MPKKLFRYIIIVGLFVVVGFAFGYLKTFFSFKEPGQINKMEEVQENVSLSKEATINPNTKIIYITYCTKCGHKMINESSADEKLIGMTKDELKKHLIDWNIESFSSDEVVLNRQVDTICDQHYYIGIQDGFVALFNGIPGEVSKAVETTDILADTLREEDRALLEKGLVITSKDEFLKIREGLSN
ncbi:MAG TPA: hypothetical protein GX534_01500 [Thermoanaerobacterales bacterium]|jgi:hypothetical protein|nr:hypothetical protein [Thermoanaerobacterales bacterium]